MLQEKKEREGGRPADAEPVRQGPDAADFYVCSLSNQTIIYKVTPQDHTS